MNKQELINKYETMLQHHQDDVEYYTKCAMKFSEDDDVFMLFRGAVATEINMIRQTQRFLRDLKEMDA